MSDPQTDWRPFWRRIEGIFDPARPAQDPALFAQRPRDYDSMHRLHKRLRRGGHGTDGQYSRYIVAGTVGNGKTSELYHLAAGLARARLVVYVDLWSHFEQTVGDPSALDRLEPWELIGLMGLVVVRAGQDRFGQKWGPELKAFERSLEALRGPGSGAGKTSATFVPSSCATCPCSTNRRPRSTVPAWRSSASWSPNGSWMIPPTACRRTPWPSSCCASNGSYPTPTRTHGIIRTRC